MTCFALCAAATFVSIIGAVTPRTIRTPGTIKIAIILVIVLLLIALFKPAAARFILTGLVICDNPEIVIGKLQIIFHLHPVAVMLRILRQFFVFIQQLRRIAARPAVNPIDLVAVARLITIAATTPAVVSIIIQRKQFLISGPRRDKCTRGQQTPIFYAMWRCCLSLIQRTPRRIGRGRTQTTISREIWSLVQRFAPFANR